MFTDIVNTSLLLPEFVRYSLRRMTLKQRSDVGVSTRLEDEPSCSIHDHLETI